MKRSQRTRTAGLLVAVVNLYALVAGRRFEKFERGSYSSAPSKNRIFA